MATSGERDEGRGKIRAGDKEVQTIMYELNKLRGYTVQHREYSQYLIMTVNGAYNL